MVLPSRGSEAATVKNFLRAKRRELSDADFLTFVVPEVLRSRSLSEVVLRPGVHRLKATLLFEPGVQVMNVTVIKDEIDTTVDQAHEPHRNYACVLVSGVHNATLQAIEFAETLAPTDIRCVTFSLDPGETERIGNQWLDAGIPHPLEVEDAPFRDIGFSLRQYVRQFEPNGIERVVTVIIPEFVVRRRRHQLLHGQTGLLVKGRMLFETGVVVASVPYHLSQ
jgi:hypothetical protein